MDDLQQLAASSRAVQDAFLIAIEPDRAALWRYCVRLTGSPWDAEDLVQESLTRAFGRLSFLWQPTDPRAYLFRIASNTWIDRVRRSRNSDRLGAAAGTSADTSSQIAAGESDPADAVAELDYLAATLPISQAVVVLLVDVFDFRLAEVASMLDVSAMAVKGQLQRAREGLRARRGEADATPSARRVAAPNALVGRFLDAFNRRDIDALAAMYAHDATADIVGIGELRGRTMIHADALSQWLVDPVPQRAEAGEFAGEPVVFVFAPGPRGTEQLHRVDRHQWVDGELRLSRTYFYTRELLAAAGAALRMDAAVHARVLSQVRE
jgi:RNA polymerase sigma factor (sigma-70 family)